MAGRAVIGQNIGMRYFAVLALLGGLLGGCGQEVATASGPAAGTTTGGSGTTGGGGGTTTTGGGSTSGGTTGGTTAPAAIAPGYYQTTESHGPPTVNKYCFAFTATDRVLIASTTGGLTLEWLSAQVPTPFPLLRGADGVYTWVQTVGSTITIVGKIVATGDGFQGTDAFTDQYGTCVSTLVGQPL